MVWNSDLDGERGVWESVLGNVARSSKSIENLIFFHTLFSLLA